MNNDHDARCSYIDELIMMMHRWAPDDTIDKQPEYLKSVLNVILDIFKEYEKELRPEGGSFSVNSTIEEVNNQNLVWLSRDIIMYITLYIN